MEIITMYIKLLIATSVAIYSSTSFSYTIGVNEKSIVQKNHCPNDFNSLVVSQENHIDCEKNIIDISSKQKNYFMYIPTKKAPPARGEPL